MRTILLFIIFFPVALFAATDFYPFDSSTQQQRFTQLTTELRCLVCQNQNLAESNAPLAADLRQQVYQHIRAGESDDQIINYLVSRYGDFILYRPPVNKATLGLWLAPGLFLLIGIGYLLNYIRKKNRE